MFVKDIERNVGMTLTLESGTELRVRYIDMVDHVRFSVESSELTQIAGDLYGKELKMRFFQNAEDHELRAIITEWNKDEGRVELKALAEIKRFPLRQSVRITHTLKVGIWHDGDYICDGLSNDLSRDGMGLRSDHELEKGEIYVLSFALNTSFRIRAHLVRKHLNTSTKSYKYEYGFVFGIDNPKQQDALLFGILDIKLKTSKDLA